MKREGENEEESPNKRGKKEESEKNVVELDEQLDVLNSRRKKRVVLLSDPKPKPKSARYWNVSQEDLEKFLENKDNIVKQFQYVVDKLEDPHLDKQWFTGNLNFLLKLMAAKDRTVPAFYEYDRILPGLKLDLVYIEEDENDPFETFLKEHKK
jgi:hypothetical protein